MRREAEKKILASINQWPTTDEDCLASRVMASLHRK